MVTFSESMFSITATAKIRKKEMKVKHVQLLIAAINAAASDSSDEIYPRNRRFSSLEGQSLKKLVECDLGFMAS